MNVETLYFILSISGAIIVGLIMALWKVGLIMSKKMGDIGVDVAKILVVNGINNEKLKTHEEQIQFLQIKQHDNAEEWKELYKNYNLNEIKHR